MWGYTLRELNGYAGLASARMRRERASELSLATLASRGDAKSLKKQMNELDR